MEKPTDPDELAMHYKRFNTCLTEEQLSWKIWFLQKVLYGYVLPLLILFGVSGNILNLTVLMAPNMRTSYEFMKQIEWFRVFHLTNKQHLVGFANWMSASAMWLVLVICLERLIGIKYPLSFRKRNFLSPKVVIPLIVAMTGLLTCHHHFSWSCQGRIFCGGNQTHMRCLRKDSILWFGKNTTNPTSELAKILIRYASHVQAIFTVFIPIILVLISNVMLLMTLRQRQKLFAPNSTIRGDSQFSGTAQAKTEHKVTITVTAIVTCFTITQGPSAIFEFIRNYQQPSKNTDGEKDWMATITATLVVIGKALNFVLFCLSSATFRQRLLMQTKQGLLRKSTRTVSMVTTSTVVVDSLLENRKRSRPAFEMTETEARPTPRQIVLLKNQRTNSSQSMGERMPLKEIRRGTSFV
ncbi:unnamed protein product [Caenorhabditis bovis]|uniref:G-protein coupled receptors family 1 profile domain-containing protein n=1 Tax=Caenorhabditis bovis TaxID=2654633 RepID=A0A8S1ERS4_9PELO|nr:unnamed protein product [Caenorhabditis bovis]